MKITLSKSQWEKIGKQTGWIKIAETKKTYKDKNNTGRTITLDGPDTIDPNFTYTATIRDEMGTIESVFSGTLAEIYLGAKERNFAMPESIKELQAKNSNVIKTADSQNIDNELKLKHPIIHALVSRMPGYKPALDIVDNIKNNNVAPENAGINQDIINQAKQIIKNKTASSMPFDNTIIIKEALTLDSRVIAAIILVILGIALGKSMLSDVSTMKAIPSQAEQVSEQLGVER